MKQSRSTYRDVVTSGIAWQKQLRDQYLAEGTPPAPHLDLKRAEVRLVSARLAESIILKYEWLGTMAHTNFHYGIFYGNYCAGVVCYGVGAGCTGARSHMPFSIEANELACLARGACVHWAPKNSNSRLISISARLLARDTHARLVLAYSDTDAGEIGTVYQACSWTYIGRSSKGIQWVAPSGRPYHSKLGYDIARRARIKRNKPQKEIGGMLREAGWKQERSNQKHKYALVVHRDDRELLDLIETMRLPYPKRAESIVSDALCDQQREGGASTTSALQLSR